VSGRTEIAIEAVGVPATLQLKLALAPFHVQSHKDLLPFNYDANELPPLNQPGDNAVRNYGQMMLSRLFEANPGVKEALESALKQPAGNNCSIYFRLVNLVEMVHWETLCDTQGRFLALDRRWPVGRIAQPDTHQQTRWHTYSAPLRILALISAAGADATPEWDALYQAVSHARNQGLQVEIAVFVGQEALQDKINANIKAGKVSGTVVRPMPDRHAGIEDAIEEFKPQILHFFCHGYAGHGVAQLELATLVDEGLGKQSGSTVLHIDELRDIAALPNVDLWLVTLNCCKGAKAAAGLPSISRSLVMAGIPAVVGMAEPVGVDDAHEFARNFYSALLAALAGKIRGAQAGVPVDLEWAELLYGARVALRDLHGGDPATHANWAIPVLYVRPEAFGIYIMDKEMGDRIALVAGYLRNLPADTPDLARNQAIAVMLHDVPAALRPDRLGNFEQPAADAGSAPGAAAPADDE
jgi:hypothetical protein